MNLLQKLFAPPDPLPQILTDLDSPSPLTRYLAVAEYSRLAESDGQIIIKLRALVRSDEPQIANAALAVLRQKHGG